MSITMAVVRERLPGESRVALVPETAKKFAALGAALRMEQSAGTESHFLDSDYTGVSLVGGIAEAYAGSQLILRVTPPSPEEIVEGIRHGVRKVNIDTDIRLAMTGAMRKAMAEKPEEFDPRAFLKAAVAAARDLCRARFEAFGSAGRASRIRPVALEKMAQLYR